MTSLDSRARPGMVGVPACVMSPWIDVDVASMAVDRPGSPAGQRPEDLSWELAQDALEDVAVLRHHRRPAPHESWRDPLRAEERLLAHLDAILSCGPSIPPRIAREAEERASDDPDFVFAAVLTLGCIRERAMLHLAIALLRSTAPLGLETQAALIESWALVPHPEAREALIPLLTDSVPDVRRVAVATMGRRGELLADEAVRSFLDPDPAVAAAAARYSRLERPADLSALSALLSHGHETVRRHAAWSLHRQGRPDGRSWARAQCREGGPSSSSALLLAGIAGFKGDLSLLLEGIRGPSPPSGAACAAALYGSIQAMPLLIERLASAGDEERPGLARALEILSGAGLTSEVEVPVHSEEDLEFLDRPPQPMLRSLPSLDASSWQAWWEQHRRRFDPERRHRGGVPWGTEALLKELDGARNDGDRARAHLELCTLAGPRAPRFDPGDFIARQEESLRQWRTWSERIRATPGAWAEEWNPAVRSL